MSPPRGVPGRWVKFDGEYEKIFYDIETKDGEIICRCYPNAGNFHTPDGRGIDGEDVLNFRVSPGENIFSRRG